MLRSTTFHLIAALVFAVANPTSAADWPKSLGREFPKADFSITAVDWSEVRSGGVSRDRIPAIDRPQTVSLAEAAETLTPTEPVVGLVINGEARAYPLRVLIWHEIANDELGGVPVAVTYCPLCNTAVVFDRRLENQVLDFGTTGRLRNSDLIMYDRQTETWWQQFLGQAIIGTLTGAELAMLPARLESFENFSARAPQGTVLVGDAARPYGRNPYVDYDTSPRPFLYSGPMPEGIAPLARVVRVGEQAWSLRFLRAKGEVASGDLRFSWTPGQNSALDTATIAQGVDVGNVVVQRRDADGNWQDVPYSVDFAFAFAAFYPDAPIHME